MFVALGQGSVGLLFVIYILAARALGDAGFGEFMLGMTIALLLFTLPAWGTNRYASILAARGPERTEEILSSSLGLTVSLSVVYFPLVWLTGTLVAGDSPVPTVALLLGLDLLAREYGNLLRLFFRVHGAFALETVTVFAERGLMVVGALVVLLVRPDPVLLAVSFAGGRTLGTLVTSGLYRARVGRIGVRFEAGSLRSILARGTPLALRRGIADMSFRVDTVFLGVLRAANEVGWYGSVYRLMDGVLMLPNAVAGSLGPTMSANFGEGRLDVVRRLYQRGVKYLAMAGLFLGAVFAVLGESIVAFLYGEEYAPAAAALRLLAPAVVFVFLRRQATEVLDNVDRRSDTVWIFGVGLVTNVVLNAFLVPAYGYLGAAAATVATEGCLMGGMVWVLHRGGYAAALPRQLGAMAIAIGVSGGVMWLLATLPVAAVLAGGVAYVVALTLLGTWDQKDLLLLRSIGRGALDVRSRITPGGRP